MKPYMRPYEQRRFQRFDMTTLDCRLTRLLAGDGRKRENCILLDLSYAGLRFRGLRPIGVGETLELLVVLGPPANRSGFLHGCVRWVHPLDINECDCGLEFSELSKGSLLGPDEKQHYESSATSSERLDPQRRQR